MGHAHPKIVDIVPRENSERQSLGDCSDVEVELAELMVSVLPNVDKVRFSSSGTEAA